MFAKIFDKLKRELYRFIHPFLWNKKIQINGVPKITSPKQLKLGYNISINDDVYIQAVGGVKIGNNVTLSYGTTILTTGLDICNYDQNYQKRLRDHIFGSVEIGDGVWCAAKVTILPGVKIADGCVIAAGAVVTKDLDEPNCLYGGVPAKLIRKL